MLKLKKKNRHIKNWKEFRLKVRNKKGYFLRRLDDFQNSILVTGCQRSGTTMLSRIITTSDGMVNYWFGRDDELDAALILAGYVEHIPKGRYCFQTTYLNECYKEYFEHNNGHKIIWVLRNPFSVVYSLLYNWNSLALTSLFKSCGAHLLEGVYKRRYERFGRFGVGRVRRACLAYNGKVSQFFELKDRIAPDRLLIIDYDDLVMNKNNILPDIYRFIDLEYKKDYASTIHSRSVNNAKRLSRREVAVVESLCMPIYLKTRSILTPVCEF